MDQELLKSEMAHNYLVTAHPPTAVTACATGNIETAPFILIFHLNFVLELCQMSTTEVSLLLLSTGHFTSPTDLNLVLAKVNQIEILVVTPEGLRPVKQFTINGRVQVNIRKVVTLYSKTGNINFRRNGGGGSANLL